MLKATSAKATEAVDFGGAVMYLKPTSWTAFCDTLAAMQKLCARAADSTLLYTIVLPVGFCHHWVCHHDVRHLTLSSHWVCPWSLALCRFSCCQVSQALCL